MASGLAFANAPPTTIDEGGGFDCEERLASLPDASPTDPTLTPSELGTPIRIKVISLGAMDPTKSPSEAGDDILVFEVPKGETFGVPPGPPGESSEDKTKRLRRERDTRASAFLTREYPDSQHIGNPAALSGPSGLRSRAVRVITDESGKTTHIVLLPSGATPQDWEAARLEYVRIAEFLKSIDGAEGAKFFPKLYHANVSEDVSRSRTDSPALVMEDAKWGSIGDNLGNADWFGPTVPPLKMLEHLRASTEGLNYLHSLGKVHGDVKPDNLLLTGTERNPRTLIGDLGGLLDVNKPVSAFMITANYINSGRGPQGDFGVLAPTAQFSRDLYAMMVTDQERLLGKSISKVDGKYLIESQGDITGAVSANVTIQQLRVSPHSIDPRISPILSALSWVPPETAAMRLYDQKAAKSYLERGDVYGFFKDYFGPTFLEPLDVQRAAALIDSADELRSRFESGTLGLKPTKQDAIRQEIARQRAAVAP
ncbi:serine/threonine-protein kinase [bacterium]|nr:serine/threonine-protein kinase [bacterium]